MNIFLNLRKANNFKQRDIAEKLRINRSTVSKWENGEFLPSPQFLIKLADIYSCSTDELLGRQPQKNLL